MQGRQEAIPRQARQIVVLRINLPRPQNLRGDLLWVGLGGCRTRTQDLSFPIVLRRGQSRGAARATASTMSTAWAASSTIASTSSSSWATTVAIARAP